MEENTKVINMKEWQKEKNVNKLDRLCRDTRALFDEVCEEIKNSSLTIRGLDLQTWDENYSSAVYIMD